MAMLFRERPAGRRGYLDFLSVLIISSMAVLAVRSLAFTFMETGMIFVPSKDGISHSRYEYTAPEDIENGCNVLLNTVIKLDEK